VLTLGVVTETTLVAFGWSEGIALVAAGISLGISLVSLGIALRADRRAGRAERRDEERIEREREQADAAKRAQLAIWATGSGSDGTNRRFAFRVINHGNVPAHNVHVWLYDEDGQDVSVLPQGGFTVKPEEAVEKQGVSAPLSVEPLDVRFGIRWEDGAGHHKLMTHIPPTL
jgi:hypothetical protein